MYIVVQKAGVLPVYTVKPESKEKPIRTLHRDLLLPCGYLPAQEPEIIVKEKKEKEKTLPSIDPIEEEADDEESFVHVTPSVEPMRFSTVIDMPTVHQPALPPVPPVSSPPQSFSTQEDVSLVEDGLSNSDGKVLEGAPGEPEIIPEVTDEMPECFTPVVEDSSEDGRVLSQNGSPTLDESAEPSILDPVPDSPVGASTQPSPDLEPVLRRSTRSKTPPTRLQYSRLGHPLLKSIQSLLTGLSSAFAAVLLYDEDVMVPTHSQSAVCRQPGPCPRTYMGSGGESVTQVT